MLIFLFNSSVYRANGTTLLKAEFLICLKGVNFSGVLFCGFLFYGKKYDFHASITSSNRRFTVSRERNARFLMTRG